MIKQHYFISINSGKYKPVYVEGDFHIFTIQTQTQTNKFTEWIQGKPLELVYESPLVVNYRNQAAGAVLKMFIYRATATVPVQQPDYEEDEE